MKPPVIAMTFQGRLAQVGMTIYGEHWRGALALALGVTPQTMSRWLAGSVSNKDVDSLLIDVLTKARAKSAEQEREMKALEHQLVRYVVRQAEARV
jgi:hypothetical protein